MVSNERVLKYMHKTAFRNIVGDHFSPSSVQIERVRRVLDVMTQRHRNCHYWCSTIAIMVQLNLTNPVGRYRRLSLMSASPNRYNLILRYGRDARSKIKEYRRKKTKHLVNTRIHYETEEEFVQKKNQISAIQRGRALKSAEVLRGTDIYSVFSINFWMKKGLSIEEARAEVKKRAASSRSKETVEKWLATLAGKTDEEKKLINLKKTFTVQGLMARGFSHENAVIMVRNKFLYSQISQKLFQAVEKHYPNDDCVFMLSIRNPREENVGSVFVDFFHVQSGVIVEFYGDYWHANPLKYKADDIMFRGKPAHQIWDHDMKREGVIRRDLRTTSLLTIWEMEYRKDPDSVVNRIVEEIEKCRGQKKP